MESSNQVIIEYIFTFLHILQLSEITGWPTLSQEFRRSEGGGREEKEAVEGEGIEGGAGEESESAEGDGGWAGGEEG